MSIEEKVIIPSYLLKDKDDIKYAIKSIQHFPDDSICLSEKITPTIISIHDIEYNEIQSNTLQEEFDKHIKLVDEFKQYLQDQLRESLVDNLVSGLNLYAIISKSQSRFLSYFKKFLAENKDIEKVNLNSFINYLYISISKKLNNEYDIAIDENGRIVIYYNENKRDRDSKKIAIIVKDRDFVISILSRKNGLAKLSGVFTLRYPDGYHKFDSALRALL